MTRPSTSSVVGPPCAIARRPSHRARIAGAWASSRTLGGTIILVATVVVALAGCSDDRPVHVRTPVPAATELVAEATGEEAALRVLVGGALETGVALTLHVDADARPGDRIEALLPAVSQTGEPTATADRGSRTSTDTPSTEEPAATWVTFEDGLGGRTSFGDFELLELGARSIAPLPDRTRADDDDRVRRTIPLRVASFLPGDVPLPELRIRRGDTILARIEPTTLAIKSALDVPLEEAIGRDVVEATPPDALAIDVPVTSRIGSGALVAGATIALAALAAAVTAIVLARRAARRGPDRSERTPAAAPLLADARALLEARRADEALDATAAALRAHDRDRTDAGTEGSDAGSPRGRTRAAERTLLGADLERARFAGEVDVATARALIDRATVLVADASETAEVAA